MEFTQSVRNLTSLAICFVLAAGSLLSQTNLLLVSGTVKDDGSGRKLPGSVVVVYQDDTEINRAEVDKNASYSFELPLGFSYTFMYERDGFTAKKVELDFTHTPQDESVDGFGLDLDMTLFKDIDGFDTSILDTPMGKGTYNPDTRKFTFDSDHTNRMKLRIENEMNRLATIEENRNTNKRAFDVAMKAGEDAMKKKNWQEALGHFSEALVLIPDEEEAIELRDECREKLDALEAKDAEKQSVADAKQAEADAKAAEKEVERLAREEEAAQRRAEAEARRVALNNPQGAATSTATSTDTTTESSSETDTTSRDLPVAEDNSADRRAQEEADRLARTREAANDAAADAADRKAADAAAAKRAALLAQSTSNVSDDADTFFRDALISENRARAEEIEQQKQAGQEQLLQREYEAKQRKEEARAEMELKLEDAKSDAEKAEERARLKALEIVSTHRSQEDFVIAHTQQSTGARSDNSGAIQRAKDSQQILDRSIDQQIATVYEGRAEEHQEEIEYTHALIVSETSTQDGYMDQRRIDANSQGYDERRSQFNSYQGGEERDAGNPILTESDNEVPQGFHEYSYEIPNGTVIELTFRDGDKVIRYKKVLMKTGTFYFRDNRSITSSIFHRETTVVHD
jgi:hypothetical protein